MIKPNIGVLLVNLGTPDTPTAASIRQYLSELFLDKRVINLNYNRGLLRIIWWIVLYGYILPIRPYKLTSKYKSIWTEEGSPLLVICKKQRAALEANLNQHYPGKIKVSLGMCYGTPSIVTALDELLSVGISSLLVLPLYPQYSATTASVFDVVTDYLKKLRVLPEFHFINYYYDNSLYIEALVKNIKIICIEKSYKLLFSFHSIPLKHSYVEEYYYQCNKTAELIADQLQLSKKQWVVSFQSRFGNSQWLQPYTSEILKKWANSGIKLVYVVCPGFSADCLETLEEISIENRNMFLKLGGKQYHYIPALNDNPAHIVLLEQLVLKNLQGKL